MSEYTRNWTPKLAANLEFLVSEANNPNRPAWRWLEIGVFEGRSAVWVLEHLLVHPEDRYVGIDPWELTPMNPRKFPRNQVGEGRIAQVEKMARENLDRFGQKVQLFKDRSLDLLRSWGIADGWFDFVYVDGLHMPLGVLADCVLTWPLLKIGGILIIDDYQVKRRGKTAQMQLAVDQFVAAVGPAGDVLFRNMQLGLRKLADGFREYE